MRRYLLLFNYVCVAKALYDISMYQTQMTQSSGVTGSLSPHDVNCQNYMAALNSFQLARPTDSTLAYKYSCIGNPPAEFLLSVSESETLLNDYGNGNIIYLDRHNVNCNGKILTDFQLVYDSNGPMIQYEYTCADYGSLHLIFIMEHTLILVVTLVG